MTATLTYAESNRAVEYVLVFLVEGCEIAYTSHSDPAAIKALWTATGHGSMTASWRHGLEVDGAITSKIKLFDPKVEADSLTIKLLDSDDYLIGLTQAEAKATSARTVLRNSIAANETTLAVQGVGGFAASGAVYVGHERMTYTSTTGGGTPSFNGLTRGSLALFNTSAGVDYALTHGVGTSLYDGSQAVEVYSTPRIWQNRGCALYVLHKEGGTFVDGADPLIAWAGRIKSISDDGDGFISFDVAGVAEQLDSLVFSQQFQADLVPGAYLAAAPYIRMRVQETNLTGPTVDITTYGPQTVIAAGRWTHQEIASAVADQLSLADLTGGFRGENWELKLHPVEGVGPRYRITFTPNNAAYFYRADISMPALLWEMLGWYGDGDAILEISTYIAGGVLVTRSIDTDDGSDVYSLVAPDPPLYSSFPLRAEQQFSVEDNPDGTWLNQTTIPAASIGASGYGADGYMSIDGKYLIGVRDLGDNDWAITHAGLGRIEDVADGIPIGGLQVRIPDDGSNRTIKVRQVWVEYADTADLMLKLLLSTGTLANYNHATYDTYETAGFGVGLPASLVDVNSFQALRGAGYWLLLDRPQKYSEILEDALSVRGAYLVFRRGKLAVVHPSEPSNGDGDYEMTEANKADTKLTRYKRSSDGVINVAKVKFNRTLSGKYLDEVTVKAAASISDLGERKPVTIEAPGVYSGLLGEGGGLTEALETMSTALAYFSRPSCEVTRSYSHALMGLAAGDTVNLTDERVVDPTTGTRGVTQWPCWVSEARFNVNTGSGEARLVFLPEFDKAQRSRWAPTAEVASSVVTSSKLVLTCTAHKYTPSTDTATDASYFPAGSICRLIEVSPTNPASPTTYTGLVVESVATNAITLTTDPATGALATDKRFVLEFEDYSAVTSGQQTAHSFIALETTRRIGTVLSSFARTWLTTPPYITEAVSYTTLHRKRVNIADDDGEPHSVGWYIDAAHSINTQFSAGTRQLLLSVPLETAKTVASTTQTWLVGPVYVPLYGYNRTLTYRARGLCSGGGTATFRAVISSAPPRGASATDYTFPDGGGTYADVTTASATVVYTSTASIVTPSRMSDGPRLRGVWITILGAASAGTASLYGFDVYETVLT